jgi:hypothetical protein
MSNVGKQPQAQSSCLAPAMCHQVTAAVRPPQSLTVGKASDTDEACCFCTTNPLVSRGFQFTLSVLGVRAGLLKSGIAIVRSPPKSTFPPCGCADTVH